MGRTRSSFFWMAGVAGLSTLLNLLSLAGLADSFVEWRCFLDAERIVAVYQAAKALLFQFIPLHLPEGVKDYLIITASFSVMLALYAHLAEKKSLWRIFADDNGLDRLSFTIALFLVPWVLLMLLAVRQIMWRAQFERVRRILLVDDAGRKQLEAKKGKEDEKARILLSTVAGYPLLCLALLFVFSDFAYTLTGNQEIAGFQFREECPAEGEIIRIGPT